MVYSITVSKLIEKMNLKNYTPEIDTDKVLIQDPGMNRPAVQFGGFFEHFDAVRILIITENGIPFIPETVKRDGMRQKEIPMAIWMQMSIHTIPRESFIQAIGLIRKLRVLH